MEQEVKLTLAVEELPEWIRLLPLGRVELADGRPPFEVDQEALVALVEGFRSRGVDLVVDYEHQSLKGERAPAAGWIKELQAQGDGLWARVEWTTQAREYLKNREYRYFSPVLRLNPETRKPEALLNVALTNVPAIKSLPPLTARLAGLQEEVDGAGWKDALAARLEMEGEGSGEELWLKAWAAMDELSVAAGLPPGAPVSALKREVEALGTVRAQLAALTAELTTLKEQVAAEAVAREVEAALLAGKISPAQQAWALDYGRRDLTGFKAFVAQAPKVVPLHEVLAVAGESRGPGGHLTPEEEVVCRAVNITPEQYLKAKADLERNSTRGGEQEWQR